MRGDQMLIDIQRGHLHRPALQAMLGQMLIKIQITGLKKQVMAAGFNPAPCFLARHAVDHFGALSAGGIAYQPYRAGFLQAPQLAPGIGKHFGAAAFLEFGIRCGQHGRMRLLGRLHAGESNEGIGELFDMRRHAAKAHHVDAPGQFEDGLPQCRKRTGVSSRANPGAISGAL